MAPRDVFNLWALIVALFARKFRVSCAQSRVGHINIFGTKSPRTPHVRTNYCDLYPQLIHEELTVGKCVDRFWTSAMTIRHSSISKAVCDKRLFVEGK